MHFRKTSLQMAFTESIALIFVFVFIVESTTTTLLEDIEHLESQKASSLGRQKWHNHNRALDREQLIIPESVLDANRSVVVNGERIFVPKRIPKISREDKWRIIETSFGTPADVPENIRRRFNYRDDARKVRRSLRNRARPSWSEDRRMVKSRRQQGEHRRLAAGDRPWRRQYPVVAAEQIRSPNARQRYRPNFNWTPLFSRNNNTCPDRFDAVTEAYNKRLYLFAGEYVYQTWHDFSGLRQRAAYLITDVFPNGPRRVTAAMTSQKSGTTILLYYQTVYRYRWSTQHKKFYLARKSPQQLPKAMNFVPKWAMQWETSHLILADDENFATYSPYLNVQLFPAKLKDYIPNVPRGTLGMAHNGNQTVLLLTAQNAIAVYDMRKYKVVQEYPISVKDFVACLQKPSKG